MHNNKDMYIYYVPKENVGIGVKLPQENSGRTMSGTWFDPFTGEFSEPIVQTITQWPRFAKPEGDRFAILIVQIQPDPEGTRKAITDRHK